MGFIFLWAGELAGWQAGAVAAALLLSNHLWQTLAALCMTDALLLAFYVAAFYALFCDPWLESRASLFGFSAAVAAAILTKGIAGILPLAVLGLYWAAVRRQERPAFSRVCLAAILALGFAAPWFLYQLAVHPRWFWTEHIAVEILGFGAGAPPQTSQENQASVLPDAARRHRSPPAGRGCGRHSGLSVRSATPHLRAGIAGCMDGGDGGRRAGLAVSQCRISAAAGAGAGAAGRRVGVRSARRATRDGWW